MGRLILTGVVLLFLMGSCNLIKKTGGDAEKYDSFTEDLTLTRITFPDLAEQAAPKATSNEYAGDLTIDNDLTFAMESFVSGNKSERYYSGFTVLVYSGVDREAAFKTRNDLYTEFPDFKADMQYQQPRYLVKVGKFINRIEAQAYYHKLKETFPMARIIQDRFQREGYVNPDEFKDNDQGQN
ncbi:hypothetical protein SAMN06295967_10762 [Belliella buryatensis]|uniref:Sporulation related domain-containing protein n=1 Tax=Belliella buryatensis TaxID=1500549 RepID=A0A239DHY9_9BACT|nr:hypothetical protein [Belliella buryatensis]SNS31889.1 hypothetical protein SAMN06295967_10762 [Belliella buryatensis]